MDYILTLLVSLEAWAALAALKVLEAVPGIDKLVFISILTDRFPDRRRARAAAGRV